MILVVGSTGVVGQRVVHRLIERGRSVRALVRPGRAEAKVQALESAGAMVVKGDLKDAASVRAACEGIDTVVSTASATISKGPGDTISSVDLEGQLGLIAAARAAGVRHFIYVSFSGNIDASFPLNDAKRTVERQLVQQAPMAFTVVRPSYFMEVWLSSHVGFDPAGGQVRIYGSGEALVSLISATDVADYVAECVGNPAVHDQIIELGGPEPVTCNAVVQLFEEAMGRRVERTHVPEAALEQRLATADDPLQKSLAGLALCFARGDAIDNRAALSMVPVALSGVRAFVERSVRI
jgi:uncharacterized protein YbjT (DUF2867 family)